MGKSLYPRGGSVQGNVLNSDGTTVLFSNSDAIPSQFVGDLVQKIDGTPDTVILDNSTATFAGAVTGTTVSATGGFSGDLIGDITSSGNSSFGGTLSIGAAATMTFIAGSTTDFASGSNVDFTGAAVSGLSTTATDITNQHSGTDIPTAVKAWVGPEADLPAIGDREDDTIYYAY